MRRYGNPEEADARRGIGIEKSACRIVAGKLDRNKLSRCSLGTVTKRKPARAGAYADAVGCWHRSPHIGVLGLAMARCEFHSCVIHVHRLGPVAEWVCPRAKRQRARCRSIRYWRNSCCAGNTKRGIPAGRLGVPFLRLSGKQPLVRNMLVADSLRPAAAEAGVLSPRLDW